MFFLSLHNHFVGISNISVACSPERATEMIMKKAKHLNLQRIFAFLNNTHLKLKIKDVEVYNL